MSYKLFTSIIARLLELTILAFGTYWLWFNLPSAVQMWVIAILFVGYVFYLGVTLSNDYEEYKKGEGDYLM